MNKTVYYKDIIDGEIYWIKYIHDEPISGITIIVIENEDGAYDVLEKDFQKHFKKLGTKGEIRSKKIKNILGFLEKNT